MNCKYYVYILKSVIIEGLYIGSTFNLEQRVKEHNRGKVKSTKTHAPYELIHFEEFNDKQTARKRELFFKTGKGRIALKNILNNLQKHMDFEGDWNQSARH